MQAVLALGPTSMARHADAFIGPVRGIRDSVAQLAARDPPTPAIINADLSGMPVAAAAIKGSGSIVQEDLGVLEARRRAAAEDEAARVAQAERDRQAMQQQLAALTQQVEALQAEQVVTAAEARAASDRAAAAAAARERAALDRAAAAEQRTAAATAGERAALDRAAELERVMAQTRVSRHGLGMTVIMC